jgi:hypothetical protein
MATKSAKGTKQDLSLGLLGRSPPVVWSIAFALFAFFVANLFLAARPRARPPR